jgi:hypothetical protein
MQFIEYVGSLSVFRSVINSSRYCISKMDFSHGEDPGVRERRRSVNLEESIPGEYQTLGGHWGRPSEYLGSLITGFAIPRERL